MSDYPPEFSAYQIAEIERKIATFRAMLVAATIRRIEKERKLDPKLLAKRAAKEELDKPEIKIRILERLIAGETVKSIAPEFLHGKEFLASHINYFVSGMLEFIDHRMRDHDACEWWRYHRATRSEKQSYWYPLALERMRQGRKDRHDVTKNA